VLFFFTAILNLPEVPDLIELNLLKRELADAGIIFP